jgi:hypothetical protein
VFIGRKRASAFILGDYMVCVGTMLQNDNLVENIIKSYIINVGIPPIPFLGITLATMYLDLGIKIPMHKKEKGILALMTSSLKGLL